MSIGLAHPEYLWLLVSVPALVALERRAAAARLQALSRFADRHILSRTSRIPDQDGRGLRNWLRFLGLGAAIFAFARPYWGTHPAPMARTGRDVIVALDLSRSMRASDVGTERLALAKRLAWELAGGSPGDRIGLVIFGGAAFLQLPPTTDLGTFQLFLNAASPDQIGDPATELTAPLRIALHAIRREGTPTGSGAVLLLSDGEGSEQLAPAILDSLRLARLPVFVLGVGTAAGTQVPADSGSPSGPWHLDHIGRPVVSRLAEADLTRIARSTGGSYARWDDAASIETLRDGLRSIEARMLASQPATQPTERYQWPLALAVLLLGIDLLLGLPRAASGALATTAARAAAIALAAAGLSCGSGRRDLMAARQLYDAGKYQEARDAFQRAMAADPDPAIRYNAGNAQFRMRHYVEAAKSYRDAPLGTTALSEWRYFNQGNAYVRAAEDDANQTDQLRLAIEAYEEALRLDPTDYQAKWNLEIALRRRGDTDGPGSRGGGRGMAGRGRMTEEGYDAANEAAVGAMAGGGVGGGEGESAPELDPNRARRLLDTIERQQLSSHEGRPAAGGPTGGRDW